MSEGTHSNPNPPNWSSRLRALGGNKPALFIAALGVAVLSAGLLMQVFRADDVAAEREGSRSSDGAGKARVSGSQQMAQVGDQVITYDAVAKECVKRYGEEVLEKLINRTIIQQACLKRGVSVTTVEVKQEVQTIAQKFKLDPTTWYQMLQAERNLSPLQYQRDIIWPMLALRRSLASSDAKERGLQPFGTRVLHRTNQPCAGRRHPPHSHAHWQPGSHQTGIQTPGRRNFGHHSGGSRSLCHPAL